MPKVNWLIPRRLAVGDEVIVRVVETQHPDPPVSTPRSDRDLVEASERKYYECLKRKYEGN